MRVHSEAAVRHGLALIQSGWAVRTAAASCRIPWPSLYGYMRRRGVEPKQHCLGCGCGFRRRQNRRYCERCQPYAAHIGLLVYHWQFLPRRQALHLIRRLEALL